MFSVVSREWQSFVDHLMRDRVQTPPTTTSTDAVHVVSQSVNDGLQLMVGHWVLPMSWAIRSNSRTSDSTMNPISASGQRSILVVVS